MKPQTLRLLYWTPRVLCILFAVFISMFALDVFGEHRSFWQTVLALAMHLVPTALLLLILLVAWRWEWVGFVGFCALGTLYIVTMWGRFHWSVYAIISGPAFLIGALFLLNWLYRAELRPQH